MLKPFGWVATWSALLVASCMGSPAAFAQQADPPPASPPKPDKNSYNLFDPTPDDQLRQFSPDRPGKSHSAQTVDAGHVDIETELWNDTWDHWSDSGTTRAYTLANPEIRLGVTNNAEFDVSVPLYNVQVTKTPKTQQGTSIQGVGDLLVGGKVNIFGNDGGDQSLGLLGFTKIPTAVTGLGNNMAEFTLNIPFNTTLPDRFSLTVEPAFDLLRNADKQGYQGDYQFIVSLNHPIYQDIVAASLELALDFHGDHNSGHQHTLDPTITWLVTPTLQLDAGTYIGLSKASPDVITYVGLSVRY